MFADRVTHARLSEKIIFCTGLELNTLITLTREKLISSCMAMHDLFEAEEIKDLGFFRHKKTGS